MRKYIIFFVVLAFYSCNNYKYIYGVPGTQKQNEVFKNAGYLNDNQAFLCFTRNFDNEKIRVVQNDSIIFVGEISTYEGMSKVLKIDKLTNVVIEFGGISKSLILTAQQMSKYRSIYIYIKIKIKAMCIFLMARKSYLRIILSFQYIYPKVIIAKLFK